MTICNHTQATLTHTFDSTLQFPTINQSPIKTRADRLVSERTKYQNNLKFILSDIKQKMEMSGNLC